MVRLRSVHKLVSFIVGVCLVCSPILAQENKGLLLVIDDFSGGLATKPSELGLSTKYGVVVQNARIGTELKSLTKRSKLLQYGSADASEPITGMHRLYLSDGTKVLMVTHGDEVEAGADATGTFTAILDLGTADYRWNFVTWHDLAIGGDGYNQPIKTDGTDATYLGSCFAEDNGAGAGPSGTYTYKITYYTASYEVLFNVLSNSVTVTDNDIDLKMIPIAPTTYGGEDVVGRKVYRNETAGATWYLLSNGTVANNTATTLTDSDADGGLTATAYPAGAATYTPPKCKFWLVHKNRLFGANNPDYPSRIYYSEDGLQDVFVSTAYFNIRSNDGDEIAFIKNILGNLAIGKTNTIQYLYTNGSTPSSDWAISDPFSFMGCAFPRSAINTPLGIFYLARNGIYVFNGQNSMRISDIVTPTIEDILPSNRDAVWGEYIDNIYYLSYTSKGVGGSTNDRVLVYDLVSKAYNIDIANINAFCGFNSGSDWGELCAGSSSDGEVFTFESGNVTIIHSKHADFTGTFDDVRYIPASLSGDSDSPVLEIAWDCDIDGWLTELAAKDAGIGNINQIGTEQPTYDIDRPDKGGIYTSQVINTVNASAYEYLYWNETLPAGNDVTLAIRSGSSSAACLAAGYSAEFTTASGADVSGETADEYTQYRITMSTDVITETPNVTEIAGFNVKMTYVTLTTDSETSVAFKLQTGDIDFNLPGYTKLLRKLYIEHEGTAGEFVVLFTNEESETDSFTVDLTTDDSNYAEYFTDGAFLCETVNITVTKSDLNDFKIKRLIIVYDVEPLV